MCPILLVGDFLYNISLSLWLSLLISVKAALYNIKMLYNLNTDFSNKNLYKGPYVYKKKIIEKGNEYQKRF